MCPHTKYLYTGHIFTVHPGGGGAGEGAGREGAISAPIYSVVY